MRFPRAGETTRVDKALGKIITGTDGFPMLDSSAIIISLQLENKFHACFGLGGDFSSRSLFSLLLFSTYFVSWTFGSSSRQPSISYLANLPLSREMYGAMRKICKTLRGEHGADPLTSLLLFPTPYMAARKQVLPSVWKKQKEKKMRMRQTSRLWHLYTGTCMLFCCMHSTQQ